MKRLNKNSIASASNYWPRFWHEHGVASLGENAQQRVLRTLSRKPIEPELWTETAEYVLGQLDIHENHAVLDLAGGNGLFTQEMKSRCKAVTIVDVAESLLPKRSESVTPICSDIRAVNFDEHVFDRILLYAAIQYLNLAEATELLQNVYRWLKPDGIVFIGDIPDANRQWNFFDTPERRSAHFKGVADCKPIVGTWFDREWMQQLGQHAGLKESVTLDQPKNQIYAWFRFDFRGVK